MTDYDVHPECMKGVERVLFSPEQLQTRISELGTQISKDYQGKSLLLVGVLRGVVFFITDLMRAIRI